MWWHQPLLSIPFTSFNWWQFHCSVPGSQRQRNKTYSRSSHVLIFAEHNQKAKARNMISNVQIWPEASPNNCFWSCSNFRIFPAQSPVFPCLKPWHRPCHPVSLYRIPILPPLENFWMLLCQNLLNLRLLTPPLSSRVSHMMIPFFLLKLRLVSSRKNFHYNVICDNWLSLKIVV